MEKIRVLLLAILPRTQQRIKTLLNSINIVEVLSGDINNAEAAMQTVFELKPDVILLENDFPGMDGFYLVKLMHKELPASQIIILSEVASAEAVRQAMRAGACDYLSYKTVTVEELTASIDHAYTLFEEEKNKRRIDESKTTKKVEKKHRARIITFYSPKGGTGVSTIIVNMAHALKQKKQKVLVVDADLQYGDIALLNNQASNHTINDIAERSNALEVEMMENVIASAKIDILPAPNQPEQAVRITGPAFTNILKFVSLMDYDIILINTSSYITDPCFAALEIADLILLITVQEISSVRATRAFLNLVQEISLGREKIDLVLNRYDENSSLSPSRIGDSLGTKIGHVIVNDPVAATRAGNLGVPFINEYKDLPISKQITALAEHVLKLLNNLEPLPLEEGKEVAR